MAINAGSSRHAVSAATPSSGINTTGSGAGDEAAVNSSASDRAAPAAAPARGSSETRTCGRGAAVDTVRKRVADKGKGSPSAFSLDTRVFISLPA